MCVCVCVVLTPERAHTPCHSVQCLGQSHDGSLQMKHASFSSLSSITTQDTRALRGVMREYSYVIPTYLLILRHNV